MNSCPGPKGFLGAPNVRVRTHCPFLTWCFDSFQPMCTVCLLCSSSAFGLDPRQGESRHSQGLFSCLARCRVALPRMREPLTPAPVPADLSDLGSRHQRAQGQWGLTFQAASAGTPASSRWELGLEGHQAVIHTSLPLSSILLEGKGGLLAACWARISRKPLSD